MQQVIRLASSMIVGGFTTNVKQKKRKRQKAVRITIWLLLIFCILLMCIGVWLFLQEMGGSQETVAREFQVEGLDPAAKTGVMPGSPGKERSPGENLFGYRINTEPAFSSNGKGGNIAIENPAFNKYLLVLEITGTDDPALLYQSQYIAPNQYIETIDLSSPPAPGTYDAMAYLNLIDPKTMKVADILECPLTLSVKSK